MRTIALEEHFVSQRFIERVGIDLADERGVDLADGAITDLAERRLIDMDAAGIDIQVLSHVNPNFRQLDTDEDIEIASGANDQAAAAVTAHPDRFAAFAALPLTDPPRPSHRNAERLLALDSGHDPGRPVRP